MTFEFTKTHIPGVIFLEPKIFVDNRGAFSEVFNLTDFKVKGIDEPFVQANLSRSWKNVLRGLHYQNPPAGQGKLIGCIQGEVYDVALDIRKGSPTYGRWVGVNLSEERRNMMYIPRGFAHGFCVLSQEARVIYYCTNFYAREHERSILWNDPKLEIPWPVNDPILSEKDIKAPTLEEADNLFIY